MKTQLSLPQNHRNTRLSDAVYETLLEAILSGQLAPGTAVSEVALAKQLEVSRIPVHDALRQLEKDGLVDQQTNRRAIIATFSAADVHDIFEMRKLLEGESAYRAATGLDRPTLQHLRDVANSLENLPEQADGLSRWADFDAEFHDVIAKASGSKRLWQDISRYRLLHRGFNILTTNPECLQQALEEHLRILDALEQRNPDLAKQAMVDHIQEWQAYFVNHFPGDRQ